MLDDTPKSTEKARHLNNLLPTLEDCQYEAIEIQVGENTLSLVDSSGRLSSQSLNFHQSLLSIQSTSSILWKACGKPGLDDTVYDLTAGFGMDALTLALRGTKVLSLEKDPLIANLLLLAVNDLKMTIPAIQWQVICTDANDYLEQVQSLPIAYMDPFFHKKKSALPQNAMQWLKKMSSVKDNNSTLLFNKLMLHSKRLVVKRPKKLPSPYSLKPNTSFFQKTTQLDVYIF